MYKLTDATKKLIQHHHPKFFSSRLLDFFGQRFDDFLIIDGKLICRNFRDANSYTVHKIDANGRLTHVPQEDANDAIKTYQTIIHR